MPAVVTFWRFPEEEEGFIRFLQSSGPVVAVPQGKVQDKSQLNPVPVADLLARNPSSVLLGLPNLLREWPIRAYRDERGESYAVLYTRVPVLNYLRGRLRAPNQLSASNISGDWTVLSEDNSKILDQPEEFTRWGRKVLAWIRKETPEWHEFKTYRITKRVSDAIKSGLQIVP
jgi:hypothetical protein